MRTNILDTRDLYKRKCELEELRDAVTAAQEDRDHAETNEEREAAEEAYDNAVAAFSEDEQTELRELEELEHEIGESTFRHGETMVPESDFEDYARQLAEDIGAIPDDAQWPCNCIDLEQAARELQMDYTSVTYQGTDYLVRA